MAHIIADRVKEITTTTGTGTVTLAGAVVGSRTFASEMSNADTCYYCIDDSNGNWEIGIGTYSSSTLARTAILESSNSGSLVDFPSGDKAVFLTNPSTNIPLQVSSTFTPAIAGITSAGTGTYATQSGTYHKTGKLVYFTIELVWTAHTGTGNMRITGLPFTASGNAYLYIGAANFTISGYPVMKITDATTYADVFYYTSTSALTAVPMDTAANLYITGVYRTA